MSNNKSSSDMSILREYIQNIEETDTISDGDLQLVLFGLFSEVGSIMAIKKKQHREKLAYPEYQQELEEEFGDALWYFVTLCRRLDTDLSKIAYKARNEHNHPNDPVSDLGKATSALFNIANSNDQKMDLLCTFFHHYLESLNDAKINLYTVTKNNAAKVRGRFILPDFSKLPTFDDDFPKDEQIPQSFEIRITQRKSGQSYLQWNGVFIGDPLTDNSVDPDGYRFHDVFHLANAAILHWSPVFRGLIKQKRKSAPKIDEIQDGGRASVIEEGLSAWVFSRAKDLNFFEGHDKISFNMLKTIQQFVRGYEVEKCPLYLWERAILKGYEVFRQVRDNEEGIVIGNREERTIAYTPINKQYDCDSS